MSRHLHNTHKLKPSLNNSQKIPPLLSSSKEVKPARHNRPKTIPLLHSRHMTIPLLHCNHKTNPFLNNDNNTLRIHLHLYPAKTVIVHFQIMAQNSNRLLQKIPVPYQRNRDTVYIQNLIRFNQFCLIFSLYTSLQKYISHIPSNFFKNFRFSVIYLLKCLLLSHFSTNQTHLSYFFFSAHILFHTNLNLVHVLILVSSFHSSSIVLSLFHTNLNLVHVLVLVSSFRSSSIVLSLFHTNLNLVHVLVLVSSFCSSSIVYVFFILILTLFMFSFLFPVSVPVQ